MPELGRRRFLAGAAVAAGASVAAACSSGTESTGGAASPTFVLVGGSAAPSFFWTPLVRELAFRGARALPVELPGHGLDAQFPLPFQSPQDVAAFAAPENAESLANAMPPSLGDVAATGVARTNLRTADSAFLDAYQQGVMADVPRDQLLAALNYLQQPDESVLPTLEDIAPDPEKWGRIPRTFVRLTADRFHTVALQDKMIRDADALAETSFDVHDIDSSHAGFIVTQPGPLADVLVGIDVG